MRKIKYALFDFDGTLVDSQWFWNTIILHMLRDKGHPVGDEDLEFSMKTPFPVRLKTLFEKYGEDPATYTTEDAYVYVTRFYDTALFWKPGALEFLTELKRRGIQIALCSATRKEMLDVALKHLGAEDLFDHCFSVPTVGVGKDNPEYFAHCLNALGATKEDAVFFEDALYSIRTAKEFGMTVYAVHEICSITDKDAICAIADGYEMLLTDYLDRI